MDYFIKYWPYLLGVSVIISGYIVLFILPQLRKNDMKNVYQSLAEPRVLVQHSEFESDYLARYEREKRRYLDSGNRWAIVQVPVIFFPLNAAFVVEWFGDQHPISTIGMTYDEYLSAALAFQRRLKNIRDQHVYREFGTDKMMQMTRNQKELNPNKIWLRDYSN